MTFITLLSTVYVVHFTHSTETRVIVVCGLVDNILLSLYDQKQPEGVLKTKPRDFLTEEIQTAAPPSTMHLIHSRVLALGLGIMHGEMRMEIIHLRNDYLFQ